MSIISFVLSALCIVGAVAAYVFIQDLTEADLSEVDGFLQVIAIFFIMGTAILFAVAIAAAIITALLGIFGIVCVRKNGKFALGCVIMGGMPSLLTAAIIVQSILNGSFEIWTFSIFAYFGLYTTGAAVAYIDRKKDRNL